MRACVSFLILLVLSLAAEASEVFTQANQSYEGGQYEQAAKNYEQLLIDEGPRVSVLNNLGSAYFRLEDYGRAILAFERALILDPGDPGLRANLKLAQEQATVFPEVASNGWRGIMANISPNGRAVVALLAAIALPLLVGLRVWFRGRVGWVVVLLLLNLVVLRMAMRSLKNQADPVSRGVVLASPATIRLSPFESAESRGTLSSGREVVLGQLESGYYWIDTNAGMTRGWVHEEEVEQIVPGYADEG